jgi:hypothetical protein
MLTQSTRLTTFVPLPDSLVAVFLKDAAYNSSASLIRRRKIQIIHNRALVISHWYWRWYILEPRDIFEPFSESFGYSLIVCFPFDLLKETPSF